MIPKIKKYKNKLIQIYISHQKYNIPLQIFHFNDKLKYLLKISFSKIDKV